LPSLPRSKSLLAVWLLGGAFLGLLLWSAATHGLSVDEAHYALYAYFPDWSYFDHPPMVGWLQLPAVWLSGSDLALLAAPLFCFFTAVFLVRRLALEIFAGPEAQGAANASALIALTVPMYHMLGLSLHPDGVLLPVACLVMIVVWRLRDPAELGRIRLWLGLGAALGLAGLSKYTAVLLVVSTAWVLLRAHGRQLLTRRGPWLAVAIALVGISPVLLWNLRHHWLSFEYQGAHAEGGESWQGQEVLRVLWEQIVTYGFLTTLTILLGLGWHWRDPAVRFCVAFAGPPAAVIMALAGRGGSLTYWTAYAWIAAIPIGGYGLARAWRSAWPRRGLAILIGLEVLACLLVVGRIALGGPEERPGYHNNPVADLYGWDQASIRARQLALQHGLKSVSVMNWTLASRVAWYSRPFFVYVLDRRFDQIDMWFGKLPKGQSTILMAWSQLPYDLPVRSAKSPGFGRCQLLEEMPIYHDGHVISHFDFYLCEDWDGATISAPMPGRWLSAF